MFMWIETRRIGEDLITVFREKHGEFFVMMLAKHGAAVFGSGAAHEVTFEEALARWDPALSVQNPEFDEFAVGPDVRSRATTQHDHPEMMAGDLAEMNMIIDIFTTQRVFEKMKACLQTRETQALSIDQSEMLWLSMMGLAVNTQNPEGAALWVSDPSPKETVCQSVPDEDEVFDSEFDDLLRIPNEPPRSEAAESSPEDTVCCVSIPEDDPSELELDDLDGVFGVPGEAPHAKPTQAPPAAALSRKVDEHRRYTYLFEGASSALCREDEILAGARERGPDPKKNLSARLRFLNSLMADLIKRSTSEDLDAVTSLMDGLETALGYNNKSVGATTLVLKRLVADADIRISRTRAAVADQQRLCREIHESAGIDNEIINRAANANAYLDGFRALVLADSDFARPLTGRGRACFENLAAAAALTPQEILATPGIGPTTLDNILTQIRAVGKPCPALSTQLAVNRYADRFAEAYGPWAGSGLLKRIVAQEARALGELDQMLEAQVSAM